MQMCPDCERVYDESEYGQCPYCHPYDYDDGRERTVIVYDRDESAERALLAESLKFLDEHVQMWPDGNAN